MKEVIALLVGEEVAAAPSDLLTELARGESGNVDGGAAASEVVGEAAPSQSTLPA